MKSVIIWIVIIVLVVLGVVWLQKLASDVPTDATSTPPQTESGVTQGVPTAVTSDSASLVSPVAIENFVFSPKTLSVKKGTTVTWTNKDSMAHTVTATNGTGPSSGTLGNGASYSYTFATVGTFPYTCTFHSSMQGTVIVTE